MTMTMELREEVRRRDEGFHQRIETSDYIDAKTSNNNVDDNADDNGAAGGGTAAR